MDAFELFSIWFFFLSTCCDSSNFVMQEDCCISLIKVCILSCVMMVYKYETYCIFVSFRNERDISYEKVCT